MCIRDRPKYITLYQIDRGYINCTLNRTELKKLVLSHVSSNKARMHENKGRAIVEHTSITPHATPHIGHGRNAVLGDTLARLLSFYGYDVQTHYFVNDLARQLAMLTMLCEYKTPPSFQQLTNQYAKLSPLLKRDKSFQKLVRDYCYKLELGEHSAKKTLQNILEIRLSGIKKHFQAINIQYDLSLIHI